MAFIAKNFSFNGVPCEEYGLKIYDIDGNSNDAAAFASAGDLVTDYIPSRGKTIVYGRSYETPLTFPLVFGLYSNTLNENEYFDRYEMAEIANWLTGPDNYQSLVIEQPDMGLVKYNCMISELEPINIAWLPFAFKATITCDSPYGYTLPMEYEFDCSSTTEVTIRSKSNIDKLYYPAIEIELNGSDYVYITNSTCGVEMYFDDLPVSSGLTIYVNGETGVITTSNSLYSNMYKYFNFTFLPLKKGLNNLSVTGDCALTFNCEYPVNMGG